MFLARNYKNKPEGAGLSRVENYLFQVIIIK
mgnify:FL=1